MSINTEGKGPLRQPPYSVPIGITDKVKSELDALEEAGVIEWSDSPWASPLVPVRKPDGAVRLCVDFQRLNAITVVEPITFQFGGDNNKSGSFKRGGASLQTGSHIA